MITKQNLILIALLTSLMQLTQASTPHRDTLALKMPNNVLIEQLVDYRQPSDVLLFNQFKSYLMSFIEQFEKLKTEPLSPDHPTKITFKNAVRAYAADEFSISVEDYKRVSTVTLAAKDSIWHLNKRTHMLELSNNSKYDHYKAYIHFSTIDQLYEITKYDFDKINQSLQANYEKPENKYLKHKPFTSWINVSAESETEISYNQIPNHPTDVIQLSAGTGLQNLKGEWLGSFNTKMTVLLSRKMVDKHAFSFTYEWMYNFTSPSDKYVNDFIEFGYSYNFSSIAEKDKWAGLNFGFLANRKGEFFDKNTYRLGLSTNLGKSITVAPQIYFNDFFKNVYPGLNISISIL